MTFAQYPPKARIRLMIQPRVVHRLARPDPDDPRLAWLGCGRRFAWWPDPIKPDPGADSLCDGCWPNG